MNYDALERPEEYVEIPLKFILPVLKEVLDYCAGEAMDNGAMAWDDQLDQVVYHFRPDDQAQSLFEYLRGVEDIWIFQSCMGGES